MTFGTPASDWDVDESLVRELLQEQHPDFVDESIELVDAGWDNVIYRLGNSHAIRLPRRKEAIALIKHEQTWLTELADRLPIPIPAPVRIGRPSGSFPAPWSIVPWLRGNTSDLTPPGSNQAQPFAEFLRAVHRPAPANAPQNHLRGVPIASRRQAVEDRLSRLRSQTDAITPQLRGVWEAALAVSEADESCWLHGDLHARNVLVEAGRISGIIDWGDVTSGDAATDLASVWMLFPQADTRVACLEFYQPSPSLLARAKGWAIFFGTVLLETGVDHPAHAAIGAATLQRLDMDAGNPDS